MDADGRHDDATLPDAYLDAYLAGELRGDELQRVEAWLRAMPGRKASIDHVVASLTGLDGVSVPSAREIVTPVREAVRAEMSSASRASEVVDSSGETRRVPAARQRAAWRTSWFAPMLGVATVALVVAVTPWLRTTLLWSPRVTTSHTYVASRAQQLSVTLADGSRVMLAPDTRLRYTMDRDGTRVVDLVGEAFFHVAPRSREPFVVHTGAVTTWVLGTAFDVRRYSNDNVTQIAVVSGRVATSGRATPVVLAAGAVAYATDSTVTVNTAGDTDEATGWTRGHLVFNDAPVPTMLATLGRWYGYEFHLSDSTLAAMHVSVVLSTDKSAYAMNTVKAVLGVTMTFDGNVVTLHPEHDNGGATKSKRTRELLKNPELEVGR